MPDNNNESYVIEKICHENDCADKIADLSPEEKKFFITFTFCPYCAEELSLICPACREELNNNDYKYCPWCGVKFADKEIPEEK
ncbi:MAG: hypothetical protein LBS60_15855 [Deltaproteobacteria bacterium]|jgi:predicted amidophosphoribosyltransferase|nr:hypothetical protein [Deltaproteobacteria bacterium]